MMSMAATVGKPSARACEAGQGTAMRRRKAIKCSSAGGEVVAAEVGGQRSEHEAVGDVKNEWD